MSSRPSASSVGRTAMPVMPPLPPLKTAPSLRGGGRETLEKAEPHGVPLGGEDRVDDGVAEGALAADVMAAEDAVLLRAEPLDRGPRLPVVEVRAELDGDAVEHLERAGEQQQLRLDVDAGPLRRRTEPGRADLEPAVGVVDGPVGGHPDRTA